MLKLTPCCDYYKGRLAELQFLEILSSPTINHHSMHFLHLCFYPSFPSNEFTYPSCLYCTSMRITYHTQLVVKYPPKNVNFYTCKCGCINNVIPISGGHLHYNSCVVLFLQDATKCWPLATYWVWIATIPPAHHLSQFQLFHSKGFRSLFAPINMVVSSYSTPPT